MILINRHRILAAISSVVFFLMFYITYPDSIGHKWIETALTPSQGRFVYLVFAVTGFVLALVLFRTGGDAGKGKNDEKRETKNTDSTRNNEQN